MSNTGICRPLSGEELAFARQMQPRSVDFQQSCDECGRTYCRRCDHRENCECGRPLRDIPTPCGKVVRAAMEEASRGNE